MSHTPSEQTIHLIADITYYVIWQTQDRPYVQHDRRAIVYAVYNLHLARILIGVVGSSIEDSVRKVLALMRTDEEDKSHV